MYDIIKVLKDLNIQKQTLDHYFYSVKFHSVMNLNLFYFHSLSCYHVNNQVLIN